MKYSYILNTQQISYIEKQREMILWHMYFTNTTVNSKIWQRQKNIIQIQNMCFNYYQIYFTFPREQLYM